VRRTLVALIVVLAVGMTASAALASSPHFKKGGEPVCTFSGTTSIPVTCTGTLSGLGMETLVTHLSVNGFALYQCQNGGGQTAAGQNKVLEGPATSNTAFPANEIKNGNLSFSAGPATLTAAPTVSGAVAGCPNPNWTGVNPVLTITDITLDIYQPGTINSDGSVSGTRIFHCTASSPSGLTSPVTLTCTSP
jgi:hypothetical protein